MTSLLTASDWNVGDLRRALDESFGIVFPGEDPGTVIDRMKVVLRMVAYPHAGETPDPDDLAGAEHFFTVLLDRLKV